MTTPRPGEPTPTPRPGTGPKMPENEQGELLHTDSDSADTKKSDTKSARADKNDDHLHPQEMSREEVESEMPADPDPDDPMSPS